MKRRYPLENYLGEFTSELDAEDYITEFVSAGRNYAYVTKEGKACCKVRGFTLSERGRRILHFHSMKDLVLEEILEPEAEEPHTLTLHNPYKIQRQKQLKLSNRTNSTNSCLTRESFTETRINPFHMVGK